MKQIAVIIDRVNRTVDNHVENIKRKFNANSRPELIEKAIQAGYLYNLPSTLLKNRAVLRD